MSNQGKVYLDRTKGPWRMKKGELAPTGNEFESFCIELANFLEGYFLALGLKRIPAYVQGDFFGERTEAIHFRKRSHLTKAFIRSIQKWLSAARRINWRIVIPGKDERFIVIYHDAVATSPEVRSLDAAIADIGKAPRSAL